MAAAPHIVLTNDDGIDSTGLRALHDALAEVGEVTVVAPASDQSAVGRSISDVVAVEERDLGYAIAGTPSDCVVSALEALAPDADLVVAGCNVGANIGMYVLGRSGTVSAAVEATFFDVPSIAVSLYVPETQWPREPDLEEFDDAAAATAHLARQAPAAGVFEQADYLNVNAPLAGGDRAPMEVTRPSHAYEMGATHENGRITLHDRMWDRMTAEEPVDAPGTDRRAVAEGRVSVSPLTAPHTTQHHEALDDVVAAYP